MTFFLDLFGMPNQYHYIRYCKFQKVGLHGASSARVPSGHTPCAPHRVQARQLYLQHLRGLEASARVTGEQSIAIDSHLVAFGPDITSPAGSCCLWILESGYDIFRH